MKKPIRIGFIGLNPNAQWASKAHIPALKLLKDDFAVTGVANTSYESAQTSAQTFGIPFAFENAEALIASEHIDLVVITVKVPYHFKLVKAALQAGKHVYCEHPLGNGLAETVELAELAASKNVVAVTGLQMTVSPEVRYMKQLINDGYLGDVLSTTLIGSGGNWRDETVSANYYLYDKENGATMLTIPLGHTLAGLTKVLGDVDDFSSYFINHFKTVILKDNGEIKPKTADDQIMMAGTLKSGAAISVHYRAGMSRGTNLLWEINGTKGDLQITGGIGHGQLTLLTLKGANGLEKELRILTPPEELYAGLPADSVVGNVARIYAQIASDIQNNTRNAPSFDDGVKLYKLIDAIEKSAER
ncbi:Gfo/Idh/MocA family oxidoreductase [Chryseobacterium chendengshani]|uniref:Gfo/Idh/MocA family protein n=1 Tax=Chryseobacterium sp. LJ668 TaxID=2864040 RepID=UPI001C691419|nr:Gfo/Idh/MocA family oxidoreductase [Chryseobacterium sp. LJ668]MBW8523515.1 Gfo/Idh/MocA family oxidoreductase [Chryseobacterium sp. LJ668]QYK15798.1 Gfo/Idh/MocA family oxidoreductase [Chryseobacterium sp. LJ668]